VNVPVSILIPIKNEATNLPRCLASVSWASEVWVVDSRSDDGSQGIAEATGAKVVQFEFNGTWPKKKNWALDNLPFGNDWVFILDADEVMPPGSEAEISAIVMDASHRLDGYWINRRFQFMGKWLRHAYYPNWNLRLFRHRLGRFERLALGPTGSGDNEVHEHVVVNGRTGRLRCEMDHYAFPSVDVFIEKHNRYSNWEARVALERRGTFGPEAGVGRPPAAADPSVLQHGRASWRRRLKWLSHRLPARPLARFLYVYVWQRGFMDGREGYYFARLHATYELLCVAKTYEMRKQQERQARR
jgi:hypothetical protein